MRAEEEKKGRYEDILFLPHHISEVHAQMPVSARAAQFAPFAALTGFGDAIQETARLTESAPELPEDRLAELDEKMRLLCALPPDKREVTVTYFVPDKRKEGGAYRTASGRLERVDAEGGRLILEGGVCIRAEQITDIEKST